jgi:AraC-like DNA-binding protein
MSITMRAVDEPVRSRVDYWRQVVGNSVAPLEVRSGGEFGVGDELRVGEVGRLRVAALSAPGAQTARRTPALIRRSDPDLCKIDVVVRGCGVVEQDGCESRLGPGAFAFVDLSRPARWAMRDVEAVSVIFPRALLPVPADGAARLTGVAIPGDRGAAALFFELATGMARHLDDFAGAGGVRAGTAVLDLLSVALTDRLDDEVALPADNRRRVLRHRVYAYIEERLADPTLSPSTIAAAHHISVRYLHKLFEMEENTVAGWIRRRRLDRCRRDLLNPRLRDHPVSAIGLRAGFADPAHFTRAFRAAFGAPPAEYRATALLSGTDAGAGLRRQSA